uniref:Uncharacterized protein n=1 Tax=viral metagenome TaxID=1070528 RepID=A0A6C0C2K3_9ZZZZ
MSIQRMYAPRRHSLGMPSVASIRRPTATTSVNRRNNLSTPALALPSTQTSSPSFDAHALLQVAKKTQVHTEEMTHRHGEELLLRTKELSQKSIKRGTTLNMSSPLDRHAGQRRAAPTGQPRGCNCA